MLIIEIILILFTELLIEVPDQGQLMCFYKIIKFQGKEHYTITGFHMSKGGKAR